MTLVYGEKLDCLEIVLYPPCVRNGLSNSFFFLFSDKVTTMISHYYTTLLKIFRTYNMFIEKQNAL